MEKSITPNQIKQNNRSLIYHYIYKNRSVSQQDISYDLHLSRPTVTSNLASMEKEGLITKSGHISTEFVGRKASAYSIIADYRVSIGVEIVKKEVKIIAVDLYGKKIGRTTCDIIYEYKESYFKTVCDKILEFKNASGITDEQLLGIGFAMQGLVSPDAKSMLYGRILDCTGLSIREFTRYLPYPCSFIHDAYCAAFSEIWVSPGLTDAFYVSLSRHLGAAIISRGEILVGKHGHSSTIEHIQIEPEGGALCYCGKYGCLETLCSLNVLLREGETLDSFFEKVRKKEPSFSNRWNIFLKNLARAINLLHLIYDTDFILGGHLAPYLCEEDLSFLHEQIAELTPFNEAQDFLMLSKMPRHNISIGAALTYIRAFLNE
ncbi:MAG: ROK family transcriptional regulator [Dorea sp.]|nr:ROK family transcriptional regulator [Dorea sp.]